MFDAIKAAKALGAKLPRYTKESRPDLFECWSDRIQWAARTGKDSDIQEANQYA